jgi:type II secretory pathway component PulL
MELILTIILAGLAGLTTLFAAWKSGRPRKDTHRTSWISWRIVTIFAGAILVLAVVHGVNLMGIQTGQSQAGFRRP